MTRDEIKLVDIDKIDKMFNSLCPKEDLQLIVLSYPILCDNSLKDRYELKSIHIYPTEFKLHLIENKLDYWEFIDELFDKYNIVELLTDLDSTMKPSTAYKYSMIVDIDALRKKYSWKKVVLAGYEGLHEVDNETGEVYGRDI